MAHQKKALLGERPLSKKSFRNLDAAFKKFHDAKFAQMSEREQTNSVSRTLADLIHEAESPCFLLSAVMEFIERIEKENVLQHYTFGSFELWLNQYSGFSFEDNYRVRSKIIGKRINRSDYEALFPIGMGKMYQGTHFVTAHKSPDLDTTVASFWGWVDAFGARVSEGLHVWNLPGGPPASQIEIDWIFRDLFGNALFTHLAHFRTALSLNGRDLISQKDLSLKGLFDSIGAIDHEREHHPVIVIDEQGGYLGDWRGVDVESVRQVVILLSSCLRWFENHLHLKLISLFVKKELLLDDVVPALKTLFSMKLEESEPVLEFSGRQKEQTQNFLLLVLNVPKGLSITFDELGLFLAQFSNTSFNGFDALFSLIEKLFDSSGKLIEERSKIFAFMEKVIGELHLAIFKIRQRLEFLDVALKTKVELFKHHPTSVTLRSDIEEIQAKMGSYFSLTVTHTDQQGKLFPLGVIYAADLRKNCLGTVSLRDFCNRDEMTIPGYLDVISVIDHHKSSLNTFSPPMAIIADVQSSNSLVAERAFLINDRHSLGGQTAQTIEAQIQKWKGDSSAKASRLMQRLLKREAALKKDSSLFIDQEREFTEYLHFLYAILDDTDLLSKVSSFDVECVVSLLNRLKSLQMGEEVEVLSLDDLPRDQHFAKMAAQRILQNEEMYSLYRKVYIYREKEVTHNLSLTAQNKPSNLFADTKEQNGCCRVGQTKLFANNFSSFEEHADAIRHVWLETALGVFKKKPEIDLHMHMISTVVGSEEVYQGKTGSYAHKDELWIWIPEEETAVEHLKRFLNGFSSVVALRKGDLEVEFSGANGEELSRIFAESFFEIPQTWSNKKLPMAVLRFKAGLLNSRKAMISPYLPNLKV